MQSRQKLAHNHDDDDDDDDNDDKGDDYDAHDDKDFEYVLREEAGAFKRVRSFS